MEVVVGAAVSVLLIVMIAVRVRHSIERQESARGRPLRGRELIFLIAAVLAALGIGAWIGFG